MPIFEIKKNVSFTQVAYIKADSEEAAYEHFNSFCDPAEINYDSNFEPTRIVDEVPKYFDLEEACE